MPIHRFALQLDLLELAGPALALLAFGGLLLVLARSLCARAFTKGLATLAIVGVLAAAGLELWQARQMGVEFDDDALILKGQVQARIEREQLLVQRLRVVDVEEQPSFKIARSLNAGFAPGFSSGWALLSNGMVVFALVGSGPKWIFVPTRDDYYLALGVQDLDGLKAKLEQWGAPSQPS